MSVITHHLRRLFHHHSAAAAAAKLGMERTSRPRMVKKTYALLEKKLLELESHLFHPSSPSAIDDESIQNRIAFLNTMLAAEMEFHSGEVPAHLQHIANRLAEHSRAFSDWVGLKIPPPECVVVDDDVSSCSCNHECFTGPEIEEEEDVPRPEEEDVPRPEEEYFREEEDNVPEEDEENVGEDESSEENDVEDKEVEKPPEESRCDCGGGSRHSGALVRRASTSARVVVAAATAATMMVMAAIFYGGEEEKFYIVPT